MVGDVVQFSCEQGYSLQVKKRSLCVWVSVLILTSQERVVYKWSEDCQFSFSMPTALHAHIHYLSIWTDCQTCMQNYYFFTVCAMQELFKVNQKETPLCGGFSLLTKHTRLVWFTQLLNNECISCGLHDLCAECCRVLVQLCLPHVFECIVNCFLFESIFVEQNIKQFLARFSDCCILKCGCLYTLRATPTSPVCLDQSEGGTTPFRCALVGFLLLFCPPWNPLTLNCGCVEKLCETFAPQKLCKLPTASFSGSLENMMFDQFILLWLTDYLVFCTEYVEAFTLMLILVLGTET